MRTDGPIMHDHPWGFIALILWGYYYDVNENGRELLTRGDLVFRPAQHKHYIDTTGVWSLVFTGPKKRVWGFWVDGAPINPIRYFAKYRRAMCD